MEAHGWTMLITVGVLLPASLSLMGISSSMRVARASVHALLQTIAVTLLLTGVALGASSAPSDPTTAHGVAGYALVFGGVPLVLLTRLVEKSSERAVAHRTMGRVLYAGLVANALVGASMLRSQRDADRGSDLLSSLSLPLLVVGACAYVLAAARGFTRRRVAVVCASTPEGALLEGAGWSWHLSHAWTSRPTVSTRSLRGHATEDDGVEWWGAGLTIREVQSELAKRGETLAGHPSLLAATLGGWVATGSHGNGGALWSPAIGRVRTFDLRTRQGRTWPRKPPVDFFSDAGRQLVLSVELLPVPNVVCLREAFDVSTEEDVRRFLAPTTHLRLLFVDSMGSLAFIWSKVEADDPPAPPRSLLVVPPWLASLLPPRVSRCLPRRRWTRLMTLEEANAFAPDPPFWSAAFMSCVRNMEFVIDNVALAPPLLLRVAGELRDVFASGACRGRCELRCGGTRLYVDVALFSLDPTPLVAALSRALPNGRFSMHRGKVPVTLHWPPGEAPGDRSRA